MATKITIDPVTRIEGHMKIEATVEKGAVNGVQCSGTLFRGFEIILRGRDPRDAQRITQRVCGVCPAVHATASTLNLDSAGAGEGMTARLTLREFAAEHDGTNPEIRVPI